MHSKLEFIDTKLFTNYGLLLKNQLGNMSKDLGWYSRVILTSALYIELSTTLNKIEV